MTILDRYIFRMFLSYYGLVALCFTALYLLVDGFEHLDNFLRAGDNLVPYLLRYYLANLPGIFYRIGPAFGIMASVFTLTRMSRYNEITPMKASGISVGRICTPIFAGAAIMAVALSVLPEWVVPRLVAGLRESAVYQGQKAIRPPLIADPDGNVLFMEEYFAERRQMGRRSEGQDRRPDVVISRRYADGSLRSRILADYGRWESTGKKDGIAVWRLQYGSEVFYQPDGAPEFDEQGRVRRVLFGEEGYAFKTRILPVDIEASDAEVSHLSILDLIAQYRRLHLPHLQVKIQSRLAYPVSNVVLLLLGIPFVLVQRNRSMVLGVLVTLVVCFAYFLVDFILTDLGARGQVPAAVAAWTPVFFFGALGWMLFDGVPS